MLQRFSKKEQNGIQQGAKWDPANYRPVSLTSQIGKIMERRIKEDIVHFLESNKLIKDSQHGFRNYVFDEFIGIHGESC